MNLLPEFEQIVDYLHHELHLVMAGRVTEHGIQQAYRAALNVWVPINFRQDIDDAPIRVYVRVHEYPKTSVQVCVGTDIVYFIKSFDELQKLNARTWAALEHRAEQMAAAHKKLRDSTIELIKSTFDVTAFTTEPR